MEIDRDIELYEVILPGIIEGFSAIATILLPILLWIFIPAILLRIIFKNNTAWNIGALLGLIAYFVIGPYQSVNIF